MPRITTPDSDATLSPDDRGRVGHNSAMAVEFVSTKSLHLNPDSARKFSAGDVEAAARILRRFTVRTPLVISADYTVLAGEVILRAAIRSGIESLPVVRLEDLSPAECEALSIAYSRLGELGSWDQQVLGSLVLKFEAQIPGFEALDLGFEVGALDFAIESSRDEEEPEEPLDSLVSALPVSAIDDLWLLNKHRLLCGDSTRPTTIEKLMGGKIASAVITDPPFGCTIDGFASGKGRHREFVQASGNTSDEELLVFFSSFIAAFLPHVKRGALVYIVIDWRSLHLMLDAARPHLGKLLNLAIWAKDRAGMGSFLRSQHEIILIFRAGKGKFRNNIQLGRHGRDRSNVWSYPSAKTNSKGSDEGNILAHHPTPKPTRLVSDAILDCTRRGDIVLDLFLGSGTCLVSAEKVGRVCYAAELDPLFIDLAIRRWQAWTGAKAIHALAGESFDEVERKRR